VTTDFESISRSVARAGLPRMRNVNAVVQRWEILALLLVSSLLQILLANYLVQALYVDVPLILVLYVAWYSKPGRAAAAGTLFGLAQDAIRRTTFLGVNGLSKTLVGFAASYLSRTLRLEDLFSRAIMMVVVSLVDSGIVYSMMLLFQQPISDDYWLTGLVKAGVTGLVGGIGSRLYDRFKFPRKDFRRVNA